jgi:putative glycosyltransferase
VMKLSIVSTLFQSEEYIHEFHRRASAAAQELAGESYEIIFVNDGSPDNSLAVAVDVAEDDAHVVVVDLSRNFGHHRAMMTGLSYSTGEKVFLIDSDLEESPEWLQLFDEQLAKSGADVAYGVQINRKGGWSERLTGWLFYRLFRLATGVAQVDNIVTARLMTRRYVDALVAHQERELNIGGLWIITGFKQVKVEVTKLSHSPTSYSLTKKFSHFVNAITSFSSLPLVAVFYTGLIITISALLFSTLLVFRYFMYEAPADGYTSLIVSIWFFSGLIILFLGIQGIYVAKVFSEVKQRPYTVVRSVYRSPPQADTTE